MPVKETVAEPVADDIVVVVAEPVDIPEEDPVVIVVDASVEERVEEPSVSPVEDEVDIVDEEPVEEPIVIVADKPLDELPDDEIIISDESPPEEVEDTQKVEIAPVVDEPSVADEAVEDAQVAEDSQAEKPADDVETEVTEVTSDDTGKADDPALAVPIRETNVFGDSESISMNQEAEGIEEYKSARDDLPTDQRGRTEIVYGDEDGQSSPSDDTATVAGGETKPAEFLGDLDRLDTALARSDSDFSGSTSPVIAVDPAERIPDDTGDFLIVEDVDELEGERPIQRREDPILPPGSLPEGQRHLIVPVQFDILQTGLVSAVIVEDTGKPELNTLIEQAIRKWKFARISADKTVTVRLKYYITAR